MMTACMALLDLPFLHFLPANFFREIGMFEGNCKKSFKKDKLELLLKNHMQGESV